MMPFCGWWSKAASCPSLAFQRRKTGGRGSREFKFVSCLKCGCLPANVTVLFKATRGLVVVRVALQGACRRIPDSDGNSSLTESLVIMKNLDQASIHYNAIDRRFAEESTMTRWLRPNLAIRSAAARLGNSNSLERVAGAIRFWRAIDFGCRRSCTLP